MVDFVRYFAICIRLKLFIFHVNIAKCVKYNVFNGTMAHRFQDKRIYGIHFKESGLNYVYNNLVIM